MDYDYLKPLARMHHKGTLWLLILSIVTALIAISSIDSRIGSDAWATFFLCFCVSFSAYQIVHAINKGTDALLNKGTTEKAPTTALSSEPLDKSNSKVCIHCGKPLQDGAKFCMYCGEGQEAQKTD